MSLMISVILDIAVGGPILLMVMIGITFGRSIFS